MCLKSLDFNFSQVELNGRDKPGGPVPAFSSEMLSPAENVIVPKL